MQKGIEQLAQHRLVKAMKQRILWSPKLGWCVALSWVSRGNSGELMALGICEELNKLNNIPEKLRQRRLTLMQCQPAQ